MRGWLRRAARHVNKRLVQVQNDFLRGRRVLGRPFQLTLEPGNVCNLACPLCATTHREPELPRGMLALEDARRILDAFPWTVQVVLSNWGEPFLNKDVFAIIAEIKRREIEVRLESHLGTFDEDRARALVASGLDTLVVALDGTTQEVYGQYRVGGDLDAVLANVRSIRDVQEETGDRRTELVWKFVVHAGNEHQVEDARAWAARLGMTFEVVPIWVPKGEEDAWLPKGAADRGLRNQTGAPARCHNLWQAVSVNFNGDVFPCCSEFSRGDRLGNVLDGDAFGPVWNSREYRERRAINRGAVDCSRCHVDRGTEWARRWMTLD